MSPSPVNRTAWLAGTAIGLGYGIAARVFVTAEGGSLFGVMTWSFLFVVPLVIGYLTVRPHPGPSLRYRLLAPWLPTTLAVLVAWVVGWEGAICIVMALPLLLILSSIGGIIGAQAAVRARSAAVVAALLPLCTAPLERLVPAHPSLRSVETRITVAAPPARVWREVVAVPAIQPEERQPALFTGMGFPRPISATLSHPGVGGVRLARFEGGVLFVETITDWDPERLIRFTIVPETDSIPVTTLDQHVVVGGPYFDVLTGRYTLAPDGAGGTVLTLTSELRVATPFNFYAGPWADLIMRSIQRNILAVVARRATGTP